jgi:lysophospholipase L1-like esterase
VKAGCRRKIELNADPAACERKSMRRLLLILWLGPVLVLQGLFVRLTVEKLPEAPGPREGRTGNGPVLRVLIAGDSAAAGVGADSQARALAGRLAAYLAPAFTVVWKLIAQNGHTTADTFHRLRRLPPERFDIAVTSLGVNDITSGVSLETWMKRQERIVALVRQKFGVTHVLLSAVPPIHLFPALPQPLRGVIGRQAERFNRALAVWTRTQPDCDFLQPSGALKVSDMAPDGFHPGPRVYEIWGKTAAEMILRKRGIWQSMNF